MRIRYTREPYTRKPAASYLVTVEFRDFVDTKRAPIARIVPYLGPTDGRVIEWHVERIASGGDLGDLDSFAPFGTLRDAKVAIEANIFICLIGQRDGGPVERVDLPASRSRAHLPKTQRREAAR